MKTRTEFLCKFHSQPGIRPERTIPRIVDIVFDTLENDVRRIVSIFDTERGNGKTTLLLAIAKFIDRKVIYVTHDARFGNMHGLDGRAWNAGNLRGYSSEYFIIMDDPLTVHDRKSEMRCGMFDRIVNEIRSPGVLVMT